MSAQTATPKYRFLSMQHLWGKKSFPGIRKSHCMKSSSTFQEHTARSLQAQVGREGRCSVQGRCLALALQSTWASRSPLQGSTQGQPWAATSSHLAQALVLFCLRLAVSPRTQKAPSTVPAPEQCSISGSCYVLSSIFIRISKEHTHILKLLRQWFSKGAPRTNCGNPWELV